MVQPKPFFIMPASLSDIRRLVDIEFRAFEHERVNQVLSFRDYKKASHFERSVQLYETAMISSQEQTKEKKTGKRGRADSKVESGEGAEAVQFKKVVDAQTGDIVSFAKVEFKGYSAQELRSPEDAGHESEPKMNREWFALNERLKREYNGLAEHCYIGMLATEPRYQHHGAGTMLLRKILAEADSRGVEVYLEGTDTARPLYEKHGFQAVNHLRFDPSEYGVCNLGQEHQTVMVRGAMDLNGARKSVRGWDEDVAMKL